MRGKRAVRNIYTNIILQITLAVSGLIIPKFILSVYGSTVNGAVSSITQFITYAALIEMGIGNASIVALYKPIAENDTESINAIVTSSKKMYNHSGVAYILVMLFLAGIYPLLVRGQLEYSFLFILVLCIGSVNAIDYFVLSKYKVFLIADQKYYVLNIIRATATVVLTVGSLFLIYFNISVIGVKILAVFTHLGEAVFVYVYIKRKYGWLNYKSDAHFKIRQRWNALIHQLCATIVYNTDLVVLTLCLKARSLVVVSVYTVYNLAASTITNITSTLTTGINASFGNMLAKRENSLVSDTFRIYEFVYFIILFILYTSFAVLILPFVVCYTNGISDGNYIRWEYGILFALAGLTAQIKEVSGVIINAAGHYRQTQRYALEEAVINIVLSLILVWPYGISGVLLATVVSHVWMDIRYMNYVRKALLHGTGKRTLFRLGRNMALFLFMTVIGMLKMSLDTNWLVWVGQAIVTTSITTVGFIIVNCCSEWETAKQIFGMIRKKRL